MTLAKEMGAAELFIKSDSQLVVNQISGAYQAKDEQLARYLRLFAGMKSVFSKLKVEHVPHEQNVRADLLAKLASTKRPGNNRSVIQETIKRPSIDVEATLQIVAACEDWRRPIMDYLEQGVEPEDKLEATKLRRKASQYALMSGHLFKRGATMPLLRCLMMEQAKKK